MSPTEETTPVSAEDLDRARAGWVRQPAVSILVYTRNGSRYVPLVEDQPLVIGRDAPADITVADTSLSRQHARFEVVKGAVWIEDLESTNGTRVNGVAVKREQVRPADDVALGMVTVSIHAQVTTAARTPGLHSHDRFREQLSVQGREHQHGRVPAPMVELEEVRLLGHLPGLLPLVVAHRQQL
jgi:hypothetical protein